MPLSLHILASLFGIAQSVHITRLYVEGQRNRGCVPRKDQRTFLSSKVSRQALRSTQPPSQRVTRLKHPAFDADHSLPSTAEVKNQWSYLFFSSIGFHGVQVFCVTFYSNAVYFFLRT